MPSVICVLLWTEECLGLREFRKIVPFVKSIHQVVVMVFLFCEGSTTVSLLEFFSLRFLLVSRPLLLNALVRLQLLRVLASELYWLLVLLTEAVCLLQNSLLRSGLTLG